jgi:hypothetical protein
MTKTVDIGQTFVSDRIIMAGSFTKVFPETEFTGTFLQDVIGGKVEGVHRLGDQPPRRVEIVDGVVTFSSGDGERKDLETREVCKTWEK